MSEVELSPEFIEYKRKNPEFFPEDQPIDKQVAYFNAMQRQLLQQRHDSLENKKKMTAALDDAVRANNGTQEEPMEDRDVDPMPDYLYEITDKNGEPTGEIGIDYPRYSKYLADLFHIITFSKMLYIYDPANCLYTELQNEVNTHIRDVCVFYGVSGKLQGHVREIDCHIRSMGNEREYPFNISKNKIPVMNGVVEIDYDTKPGYYYEELSTIGQQFDEIQIPERSYARLLPHGPEHLFTYKLSVNFNPHAKTKDALKLLSQWVDAENVPVLLQIPAQGLLQMQTGHAYKKAYLLQGEPHAGKTSYLTMLIRMFNPEFIASIRLQQVCDDRFTGGKLEGKLLNIYDDLEDVPLDTIDAFKTLTGSCSHDVERKYRDGYVGRVTAVHVFTCNYPPEYPDKVKRDSAFWARWEYVKFPFAYPVDPNFYERVFTDEMLSSFLNAVIEAMVQIKKGGLLVSSDIQNVMEAWSINSDPLYEFISWGFVSGDNKTVHKYSKRKLYDAYRDYCKDNNIQENRMKNTLTAFTIAIQPHGFLPIQAREKRKRYDVYGTASHKVNPENIKDLTIGDEVELS